MSKLLIVESPAKAKTIGKYLGKDYIVRASVGHVRDLPKSNKKAIDIESGFVPHYEISKGKEHIIDEIRELAKKATEIFLATDPDREGEAISWHLAELIKSKGLKVKAPIKRVVYHEITKEAIEEALKHPREIDQDLRKAQEARRVLDRLVGYDLSGLIWKKVRYGLSAGRVQSPALRIIMEREREIRAFIPENYWVLEAMLINAKKDTFKATCTEEPKEQKEVDRILKLGKEGSWIVSNLEESEAKRSPRAPFTTSTLQQTASTRLGYSPSNTMRIAQKLYEKGLITYMRTDSTTLSQQAVTQATIVISKLFGEQYHETREYKTKSKNAQEAHEAVRPTNLATKSISSTPDEEKLYSLIWRRTITSQMADARMLRSKITIEVADGKVPDFAVTGSRLLYEGWLIADPESKGEDTILPIVVHGEKLKLKELSDIAKQTEPPGRYSEAGLIKELEKRGIGRPSTYASTIRTIEERGYVEKINKALVPTDTGDVVSSFLEKTFADYISDTFTAGMEDKLDDIANGNAEYVKILSDFYKPFLKDVKNASKNAEKLTTLGDADPKFKCPVCEGSMVIKLSKNGKFLSCAKFPECNGALMMDGTEIKPDTPIGIHPETGENIFVKAGPYGPYVQLGEGKAPASAEATAGKGKKVKKIKPRMASIPKDINPTDVTVAMATKYLTLPRELGIHPVTNEKVIANVGRFGPYVGEARNFRSIKVPLDVYTITFDEAIKLLNEPKKPRGFQKKIIGKEEKK
jgi:DNA topoisomerase-1